MLTKKNRLSKTEFQKIYKKGKRLHSRYFTIVFNKDTTIKEPQIGVVASIKVAKNATDRNKIKRRVRNIVREIVPTLPQSMQIIVLTKPGIKDAMFEELKFQIGNVLKKI